MKAQGWEKEIELYDDERTVDSGADCNGLYIIICHNQQNHWQIYRGGCKGPAEPCNCPSGGD